MRNNYLFVNAQSLIRTIFFLLGIIFFTPTYASLQMQVDRNSLARDEMLTMVISSNDHISISPDLSPLKKDFYIVSTSRNSQFNMINGTTQMETQWRMVLLPKHSGEISLPALTVGTEKTQPQLIHVSDITRNTSPQPATANHDIFIEAAVIPKETFIQEQFVYTMKLFFSKSIENPYMMAPDLQDATITQNGQDIIYTATKNGKYYHVLERSYLITPKNTGHFQIQPPVLKGYLEEPAQPMDISAFANRTLMPIKVAGPLLTINVKPKPKNFVGQWLPAKKVTLNESWDPNPVVFREGEPVTRIIEVTAKGATGDQIPNIVVPATVNLNHYPQQPTRETDTQSGMQIGKLKQGIVFIPTKSGKLTLPAIKIHWWNSVTQQEQVTALPAKTISVQPALIKSHQMSVSAPQVAIPVTHPNVPKKIVTVKSTNYFWPIIATLFMVIWLVTIWLWRRQIKTGSFTIKSRTRKPRSIHEIQKQLQEACVANNPKQARRLFLEWATIYWQNSSPHSLSDVVHILETDNAHRLLKEIMLLEATFYGKGKSVWNGQSFWDAYQNYVAAKTADDSVTDKDPLPPLYFSD